MIDIDEAKEKAWDALRTILPDVSLSAPRVGRLVKITEGRKHRGKVGRVFFHAVDKFNSPFRYCGNSMQASMRQATGRYGYRIGVDTGTERFFCCAEYALVCVEGEVTQ